MFRARHPLAASVQRGDRLPLVSLPRRPIPLSLAKRLAAGLFCLLLLSGVLTNAPQIVEAAHAAPSNPAQATSSIDSFLAQGSYDQKADHGPFKRPADDPGAIADQVAAASKTAKTAKAQAVVAAETKVLTSSTTPEPAVEPATMTPVSYQLDDSFASALPTAPSASSSDTTQKPVTVAAQAVPAGTGALEVLGSDGRLEVDLPRGALDLSKATLADGTAPVRPLVLQISQQHGHSLGEENLLGSYTFKLVDHQGRPVQGVTLSQPATIRYHYQSSELRTLNLSPSGVVLSWPDQPSVTPTVMTNQASTQTLTAQTMQLSGTAQTGGTPSVVPPAIPHLASVEGNSGQLSYSYPIAVAPGPGGFAPQLALTYSSESTNERYDRQATSGPAGEGWSLELGSISAQTYPTGSTSPGTWYFLSGVDNVSDRLVSDGSFYDTEHISHLRITNGNNCWQVWDRDGWYYEFGCTPDSQQMAAGTPYRWDLDKVIAPYNSTSQLRVMFISYLQDVITDSGQSYDRDASIKQIVYGYTTSLTASAPSTIAGTVDFHYLAPTAQGSWADAYGNNYNCGSQPPLGGLTTTLRCDDTLPYGSIPAPDVMSTLTLAHVTSYVGDDSTASHAAYRYDFSYADNADQYLCQMNFVTQYCAGNHQLTSVTPTVYQNGTGHQRPGLQVFYSGSLQNTYSDPVNNNPAETFWGYLSKYMDLATGAGATISYQTAYSNTNGTPYVVSNGSVDDRYDPLYCSTHANDSNPALHCTGTFAYPDKWSWTTQVVTQLQSLTKDSSSGSLALATTTYQYRLAKTGTGCPTATGVGTPVPNDLNDCVGDNWIPSYTGGSPSPDGDFADYYHAEYRGVNVVYTTSPGGNLTADYYFSTEGWYTPQSDGLNYNRGGLYQEDVYQGNQLNPADLLRETLSDYTGVPVPSGNPYSGINTCNGTLNPTYNPCIPAPLQSRTTTYEGSVGSNAPWVQKVDSYDDINPTSGFVYSSTVYHNLTQEVVSSSNAQTLTEKWSYTPNNQTVGSIVYYDVDKPTHSEIDDASGTVWKCQDTSYDQGASVPTPAAGWVTSSTSYSDCSHQSTTALTSYTAYDVYGNAVGTVDPFGVANASLYSGNGCSLSTSPVYQNSGWTAGKYTSCTFYDYTHMAALPISQKNVLNQTTATTYDYTQGDLPTSSTDVTGQTTGTAYSYPSVGTATTQVSEPGETGSYTSQTQAVSTCTISSTTPCAETDTNSALYSGAVSRTYTDGQGRTTETRTPLDSSNDLVQFTVYDDANDSQFQSVPFRYPRSVGGWVDPATATIDNNGSTKPAGATTVTDALGRTRAVADAIVGSSSEPGIACGGLSGTWSTCNAYSYGYAYGDSNIYDYTASLDANDHQTSSFTDALGHERFDYWYSVAGSVSSNITTKRVIQYDALGDVTSVQEKDLAPQSGESTVSVTATATYDSLGRQTGVSDPDRGNHTYGYDADGRLITDVSGSRTIGVSYDILGRTRCVQDAAPLNNGSGSCSSGAHALIQNLYGSSVLQLPGTTDYATGRLTQSIVTTYYPDGSSTAATQQFEHDQRGRVTATTLALSLPSSWGVTTALPTDQETQSYNDADQPMTTQTTVGGAAGYTFSAAYDSTAGTQTGLSNNTTGVADLVTQAFDSHGNVGSLAFQSSSGTALAAESFTFDGDQRPATSSAIWSGTSNTIFSKTQSYDPVGNVISTSTTQAAVPGQSGSGGSETENFCYDEQNRLVWSGNSGSEPSAGTGTCGKGTLANSLSGAGYSTSYTYTHLGQLWQGPLNGTGTQEQYLYCNSNQPHQLTGLYPLGTTCSNLSGATYTSSYDSWGNVTSRGYNGSTATLSYNPLDELTEWNGGSTNQGWYAYDPSGERVLQRSTTGSGTSLTVYAFGLEEHVYSATGTNTGNTYYYSLGNRLIGSTNGSATQYDLTDALGSVLAAFSNTAGTASVLGNQTFDPYGTSQYKKGSLGTSKGFTGQYGDPSGLDYYGARYYDPVAGRFLSADVVQSDMQGADPYAYVGGNPETMNDPSGRCPICGLVGAVAGAAIDVGAQLLSGKSVSTLDWGQVGGAALAGGVIGLTLGLAAPALGAAFATGAVAWDAGLGVSGAISMGYAAFEYGPMLGDDLSALAADDSQAALDDTAANTANDGVNPSTDDGGPTTNTPTGTSTATDDSSMSNPQDDAPKTPSGTTNPNGSSGEACSFTATTPVATKQGEQAIGTLQVGEQVWAYNPQSKKMELQPIEHVWVNHDDDLVDLAITTTTPASKGKSAKQTTEVLHTNEKHPFLTTEDGFVPVADLNVGMHIVQADGQVGVISGWVVVPGSNVMYNLTVQQDHTYTVGDEQWVVHNCGGGVSPNQQADMDAKTLWYEGIQSDFARNRSTVAVAYTENSDGEARRLVSMNSNSMGSSKGVQALISADEWVPSQGAGLHAEENLLRYASSNNLKIIGIGASRPICMAICWPQVSLLGPNIIGTANKDGWIPPWQWLL